MYAPWTAMTSYAGLYLSRANAPKETKMWGGNIQMTRGPIVILILCELGYTVDADIKTIVQIAQALQS